MSFSRFPRILRGSRAGLAALYFVIAIIAQFFPLVGDLHYEFSAVIAIAASLLTGIVMVLAPVRKAASGTIPPHSSVDGSAGCDDMTGMDVWGMIGQGVLLSLIPLPVAITGALLGDGCGMLEGIAWYMTLVPASAAISAVLAAFARLVVCRRWVRLCAFLMLWSVSLFRGAWEGLAGPHIFLYSWQVGFFPGGSWDAELPITPLLLAYRAGHLLIAGLLALIIVVLARHRGSEQSGRDYGTAGQRALMAAGLLAAAAIIPLVMHRSDLGLTRTHEWLREELGDVYRTRFATIYYHAPTTDSLDLWQAANLTDFHIAELAEMLGIPESRIEPVTLYLYGSSGEEKRLVGTSSAAFTKPWARTLNMSFGGVGGTLRHELAHVMLAPYGNPLGISVSQGLLEGSAMALENDYLWRTLHEYARAMYEFNLAPSPEAIMGVGGFSSRRASVSYVLAGSFSRWLIERYGMQRYLEAFPWGDFDDAYGRSLGELSTEYRAFIDSLPPPPAAQRAAMRYLFGGGSFFFQKCLRRIGSLNGAGFDALAQERYERALERFRESLEHGINYGARAGVLQSLAGLGRYRELLDSCKAYAADTAGYPLLPYVIEQGDALWALGDTAGARRMYDSMLALDVSRGLSLRAALRMYFLGGDSTVQPIMRTYFTRPMKLLQRLAVLEQAQASAAHQQVREILALMRATLSARQFPLTSLGRLASVMRDVHAAGDTTSRMQHESSRLERFILSSLADGLRPAAQYAAMQRTAPQRTGADDAALEAISNELLRPEYYSFVPGSENYVRESDEMRRRFERYLESRIGSP